MNKHNQNGSVHVALVGIVAVVIIGAVGFLFWSNFLQSKPQEKTVSKIESSQKASPSPSTEVKPETLSLSDWGVQFTITDELKKAGIEVEKETTPTILADGSKGTFTDYYISTSRQRAFGVLTDENADKLCDAGSGVTLIQTNTPESPQINTKSIGGFYYRWSIPSAGGCDGPDTKAIVNALKSLKAI